MMKDTGLLPQDNLELQLSYSRISDFDRNGPKALVEKTSVDNEGTKIGSLVDDLIFDKDNFNNKYHVTDTTEPTATLGALTSIILKEFTEIPSKEEVLKIIGDNGFWSSTKKEETMIKNFDKPEFWDYLSDKFNAGEKAVVTLDRKVLADEIVSKLLTHPHSKDIFESENEMLTQLKFTIPYRGVKLRGIMDMVIIDHENKTIKGIDLKTGAGSATDFRSSFIKWRYYLQAAVYTIALTLLKEDESFSKYADYQVLPFEFLYIGVGEKLPVTYVIDEFWVEAGLEGFKSSTGYEYKGLNQLIDEITFHWVNKIFDVSKEVYDNSGVLTFKSEGLNVSSNSKN